MNDLIEYVQWLRYTIEYELDKTISKETVLKFLDVILTKISKNID